MRLKHRHKVEADLDITSFMNLMIILVPVLLMSMVFSHVSILELSLPGLSDGSSAAELEKKQLEVVLREKHIDVYYPAGQRRAHILSTDQGQDFALLSLTLQEIKRQLKELGVEKRDLTILSEADTDYQTLVSAMDTARSFKTVVVASVVNAELFPVISLGDAPQPNNPTGAAL